MPRKSGSTLVVYEHPSCPACDDVKEILKDLTKKTGVRPRYRNVDKCKSGDDFCSAVELVPTFAECDIRGKNCKEIPIDKVESRMKRMGRKK